MNIWTLLLDVVVLLGAGALLGALAERLRQSALVGYLLAGMLLGPHVLHLVRSGEEVLAVSELGVALLLFAIGLEFSWTRLRSLGRVALGGGTVQVLATGAVGSGVAVLLGVAPGPAVALGGMLALSSTASVLRVLAARDEDETPHGEAALGVLLVQDMAVVPLVLLVTVLSDGGGPADMLATLARTTLIGAGLVLGLWFVFHLGVPALLSSAPVAGNRELPLLVAVVSGLGSGVVAHAAGVSPALGAFVAGMVLAESPFAVQARADVSGLKTLLLTLFFTSVGMLADPLWIGSHLGLVLITLAGVLVVKAGLVWLSLRLTGSGPGTALAGAVCLAQTGEFSFVLADVARGRLLDQRLFLLVVSTTVLSMLVTPTLVGLAPALARRSRRRDQPQALPEDEGPLTLLVGFGPTGRALGEQLAAEGTRLVVIDRDPRAVGQAMERGLTTMLADASHPEVLEHAGVERARCVLVTTPSLAAALDIVRAARRLGPGARVLVRARHHTSRSALEAAGADLVIDEEHETGRLMARAYADLNLPGS